MFTDPEQLSYTWITRRVPLVEHELLSIPEHLSSPPINSGVRLAPFVLFLLAIVLSVLLRFTFFKRLMFTDPEQFKL
jgi:hypothetical protein